MSGFSISISFLCLFYLLKKWRTESSHMIVFTFSLLISLMSFAALILKSLAVATHISSAICPTNSAEQFYMFDVRDPIDNIDYVSNFSSYMLSSVFPIVFFWVSDAFLVSSSLVFLNRALIGMN